MLELTTFKKQTSDHSLLLLEDKPQDQPITKRFYFHKRLLEVPDFAKVVTEAWESQQEGSPMFQVCERIKSCRVALLKLRSQHKMNSNQAIHDIKMKVDFMQNEEGSRDWQE